MSDPRLSYGILDILQGKPRPEAPAPLPNFTFNPFATGMLAALPLSQQSPVGNMQQTAVSGPYPGATGSALPPGTAMGGAGWPDGIAHKIGSVAPPPPSEAVTKALQCMTANGPSNFVVSETSGQHPPGNPHTDGQAFDVKADPAYRDAINKAASKCGMVFQQDEYRYPSPGSNGGHLHFQLRPGKGGATGQYKPSTSR